MWQSLRSQDPFVEARFKCPKGGGDSEVRAAGPSGSGRGSNPAARQRGIVALRSAIFEARQAMGYDARVLEVMIASPSDVIKEREIVRSVASEWNDIHSRAQGAVLLSTGWDTHSAPELAGRPQQIINDRILDNADIVVGIFWTKIGSPTGMAPSGSVEEIQRHHGAGRPVLLYFSEMPVVPGSYDADQFNELQRFKSWAREQGLVSGFSDAETFRNDLRRHLQITLRDNEYLRQQAAPSAVPAPEAIRFSGGASANARDVSTQLTPEAIKLLKLAGAPSSREAMILIHRHLGGVSISAGDQAIETNGRRDEAKWQAAAQQIYDLGLSRDLNGKGEIFELNDRGFQAADALARS